MAYGVHCQDLPHVGYCLAQQSSLDALLYILLLDSLHPINKSDNEEAPMLPFKISENPVAKGQKSYTVSIYIEMVNKIPKL